MTKNTQPNKPVVTKSHISITGLCRECGVTRATMENIIEDNADKISKIALGKSKRPAYRLADIKAILS